MHVKHSRQNSREALSQDSDAASDWPPKSYNVQEADELLALRQPSSQQLSQALSDRHSDADDMHNMDALVFAIEYHASLNRSPILAASSDSPVIQAIQRYMPPSLQSSFNEDDYKLIELLMSLDSSMHEDTALSDTCSEETVPLPASTKRKRASGTLQRSQRPKMDESDADAMTLHDENRQYWVDQLSDCDFYRPNVPEQIIEDADIKRRVKSFKDRWKHQDVHAYDLYTPRWTSGTGAAKIALCPICLQDGSVQSFKLKTSAYRYHMHNFHGVSRATMRPMQPPEAIRVTETPPQRKFVCKIPKDSVLLPLISGKCHWCHKWIELVGATRLVVKTPQIYWWKHAQACHHMH
jgi:hypothetical protein